MKIHHPLIGLLALAACSTAVAGKKEVQLNPQHPEQYTVAAGDTLWEIAGRFLKDPWQWPDLWAGDRQSARPLHPGDVLTLTQVDGKPHLRLNGASGNAAARAPGQELPVVKLSPAIRASNIAEEIPTIPLSAVRAFLSSPKVVDGDELDEAPYLLEFADDRLVAGAGEKIYVRGLEDEPLPVYGLFHQGAVYLDGETGEELGREAVHVGDVSLVKEGDPAVFMLISAQREATKGDRLLPLEEERLPSYYEPHAPAFDLRGHIVGVMGSESVGAHGSVSRIGNNAIVVVDRGSNDGVEVGHVLDIYQHSRPVNDRVSGKAYDSTELPEEIVGNLLIFRPFERVSFGLVMNATRDLAAGDVVQTP